MSHTETNPCHHLLLRWLDRVAREGAVHACYEASGAGYVLHRALRDWGYACEVIAPSLIPKRAGVHRKHDKRDAADLARLYRAGELVPVRIPSEADERVRDVVRCRETFALSNPPCHRSRRPRRASLGTVWQYFHGNTSIPCP